jgi:uncharacterized membrane protein YeaQ/YmgE (transglycosylase-associated protein family)
MLWDIIVAIIIGLIIGAIAKAIMPGDDPGGIVVTILLGIAGSIVGNFLGGLLGFGRAATADGQIVDGTNFFVRLILGVVGALILLAIYRLATGRSMRG